VLGATLARQSISIGKTNALFVSTLPYPHGVQQCRIAAEAAASYIDHGISDVNHIALQTGTKG
jgi:hypothetical protein